MPVSTNDLVRQGANVNSRLLSHYHWIISSLFSIDFEDIDVKYIFMIIKTIDCCEEYNDAHTFQFKFYLHWKMYIIS